MARVVAVFDDLLLGSNVLGMLPGSDPKLSAQVVLYTAHHDHLGMKADPKPGEELLKTVSAEARKKDEPKRENADPAEWEPPGYNYRRPSMPSHH